MKCKCRKPKNHDFCAYCGCFASNQICGVCKEAGIDGPVIKGTERHICKLHKNK